MSDFDREAEREKLREKYERDKQKREASERMSELLLQGATMTNRHCPECHSPVFRHEGTEFCPTCQKEVTEDGELLDPEGETGASSEAKTEESEPETAGDHAEEGTAALDQPTDTDADEAPAGTAETEASDQPTESRPESDSSSPPAPASERRPARVDPPARRDPDGDRSRQSGERSHAEQPNSERGQLRDAEATLASEIESLTRRAADTRDVGRKRDLLAAAREAAETLEAVRRL
jgi:uncharacterized Zn finger protein (UPF0148 family)